MNLNDLRANAYSQAAKTGAASEEKKSAPVVKPFVPVQLTKNDVIQSTVQEKYSDKIIKSEQVEKIEKQTFTPKPLASEKPKSNTQALNNSVDYLKNAGLLKVPVEEPKEDGKDSVYRRVAKFLLIIGEDEAAKILPHLSEKQIEKIVPEIASIRSVSKEESAVILHEFKGLLDNARKSGGVETAREMLSKAYGKDKADEMIKKSMPMEGKKPFEYLNDADAERIYLLLKDENPSMQCLVLSYLEPKKAASVINQMKEDEKREVVLRMAKMESVTPDILRRVDQAMHEKSINQTTEKAENIDGRNALAMILKKMDSGAESQILSNLAEEDPDLGQDLRSRLFTMDDVLKADDRFIQEQLREMDDKNICYLIAGKNEEFRVKILSNVSAGRRAEIREQEEILAPFRRSDCEAVTSNFFAILRRAYEEGHLIIDGRNDDVYV